MYDVCFIKAAGLKIQGPIVDTMIAGSLVDENRFRYDLGSLGRDYVGRGKNEAILAETAKEWGIDPNQKCINYLQCMLEHTLKQMHN